MRNKKEELLSYVITEGPDIVCITEAWVNENKLNDTLDEYSIIGYKIFLWQRKHKVGGGVIVYVKDCLNPVIVDNIKVGNSKELVESVWIDVQLNSKQNLRLGVFYRAPSQDSLVDDLLLNEIRVGSNLNCLILGDFNLPNINWELELGFDSTASKFIDCFSDCFLTQLVKEPTRENNILDLVLASNPNIVQGVDIGEGLSNSDHNIIRIKLGANATKSDNNRLVPDLYRGDYNKFRQLLNNTDWEGEFSNKSMSEMWNRFKMIFEDYQQQCIPFKVIRKNKTKKPLWWTADIKRALNSKKRAFRQMKRSGREVDIECYRNIRNNVTKLIKKNKRLGEINLAKSSNKDPKKFFSYYKYNRKGQETVGPIENNGQIITSTLDTVNIFNRYFSSVFTDENVGSYSLINETGYMDNSLMPVLNRNEIKKEILNIKDRKACGPDGVTVRLLKEGGDSLVDALFLMYTASIKTGVLPEDWKLANITPVFKKGSRKLVSNYRPISLTSLIVKVLEKLIRGWIQTHLDHNEILRGTQHGFRSGRSCLTNLLSFLDYVTDKVDNGEDVDIVYLDFSKAFDKVPHKRLVYKLSQYNINPFLVKWIESWLHDRKQRVVLNGIQSEWLGVKSGVPQGSVLGPLLFIIYINDIDIGLNSNISKFADDTKLAGRVKKYEGSFNIQRDIDKLIGWANKWQMEFNTDKCKVVHIGKSNNCFSYEMGGQWLAESDREKDLGIVVSQDLKTHVQCLEARNKANRMLGIINRNVSYKSKDVITKLYNSYVRPHLEYCIQAWRPYHRGDIDMLEKVQRRATKLIPSLRRLSYEDRLRELNMFSFERRCERGDMIEVYKIFNGLDDVNASKFFELDDDNRTRGHFLKIKKKQCRLDVRKNFFTNRVVDPWNKLPEHVISSSSLSSFKSRLDKHMTTVLTEIRN